MKTFNEFLSEAKDIFVPKEELARYVKVLGAELKKRKINIWQDITSNFMTKGIGFVMEGYKDGDKSVQFNFQPQHNKVKVSAESETNDFSKVYNYDPDKIEKLFADIMTDIIKAIK